VIAKTKETSPDLQVDVSDHQVIITRDDRRYRVRGLAKNTSYDQLKINVMASRNGAMHIDTLDLYDARRRITFCKQAGPELFIDEATVKEDLGHVLRELEQLQQQNIEQAQATNEKQPYQMTEAEQTAARELLEAPNLIDRIGDDFETSGIVGETTNILVGFLAATSRKLPKPLAIVVQSSSAAGKSSLMDAVLSFVPPEDQVCVSAMTGQSLFYMGEDGLKHKVLAIAEDAGAEQASYALKLLQSDGKLTLTTTERNGDTGRNGAETYHVEGPTSLFLTTTASDIDDEFLNRCVVLTVDEDREQTRAIHQRQRERHTLDGQLADLQRSARLKLHHNAQRLLRPLRVTNPYADQLTFVDHQTRNRRDHEAYLTLIDTVTYLHQYQRELITREVDGKPATFVVVTLEDIALANRLAHEVLGRSIDELRPQTRKLLHLLHAMVAERGTQDGETRFTRRQIREYTGWGQTQLKTHLRRLEDMEYLLVHRGGGLGRRFTYELQYDGRGAEGQRRLTGLVDVDQLKPPIVSSRSGGNKAKSGRGRAKVGP
jgi:DNA primase